MFCYPHFSLIHRHHIPASTALACIRRRFCHAAALLCLGHSVGAQLDHILRAKAIAQTLEEERSWAVLGLPRARRGSGGKRGSDVTSATILAVVSYP